MGRDVTKSIEDANQHVTNCKSDIEDALNELENAHENIITTVKDAEQLNHKLQVMTKNAEDATTSIYSWISYTLTLIDKIGTAEKRINIAQQKALQIIKQRTPDFNDININNKYVEASAKELHKLCKNYRKRMCHEGKQHVKNIKTTEEMALKSILKTAATIL